jgi:hypothetical protein
MTTALWSALIAVAFLCGVGAGFSLAAASLEFRQRQIEQADQDLHLHDQIDRLQRIAR